MHVKHQSRPEQDRPERSVNLTCQCVLCRIIVVTSGLLITSHFLPSLPSPLSSHPPLSFISPSTDTECSPEEFTCLTSHSCVPLLFKCDTEDDCLDGSDEDNCCECDTHAYVYARTYVHLPLYNSSILWMLGRFWQDVDALGLVDATYLCCVPIFASLGSQLRRSLFSKSTHHNCAPCIRTYRYTYPCTEL